MINGSCIPFILMLRTQGGSRYAPAFPGNFPTTDVEIANALSSELVN